MTEDPDFPALLLRTWNAPPPPLGLADEIVRTVLAHRHVDPLALIFPPFARLPIGARRWGAAGCAAACLILGVLGGIQIDLSPAWPSEIWEAFLTVEEETTWL
jgi:hypothetical protein